MRIAVRAASPFAVLLILCLVMAACSDHALVTTSKVLADIAKTVGALQTTVINANVAGAISNQDTMTILEVCGRINTGGQQASAITRGLTKLPPGAKLDLLSILTPLSAAVSQSLQTGLINIANQKVKTDVQLALTTIQTALVAVQAVLAASGGK